MDGSISSLIEGFLGSAEMIKNLEEDIEYLEEKVESERKHLEGYSEYLEEMVSRLNKKRVEERETLQEVIRVQHQVMQQQIDMQQTKIQSLEVVLRTISEIVQYVDSCSWCIIFLSYVHYY